MKSPHSRSARRKAAFKTARKRLARFFQVTNSDKRTYIADCAFAQEYYYRKKKQPRGKWGFCDCDICRKGHVDHRVNKRLIPVMLLSGE